MLFLLLFELLLFFFAGLPVFSHFSPINLYPTANSTPHDACTQTTTTFITNREFSLFFFYPKQRYFRWHVCCCCFSLLCANGSSSLTLLLYLPTRSLFFQNPLVMSGVWVRETLSLTSLFVCLWNKKQTKNRSPGTHKTTKQTSVWNITICCCCVLPAEEESCRSTHKKILMPYMSIFETFKKRQYYYYVRTYTITCHLVRLSTTENHCCFCFIIFLMFLLCWFALVCVKSVSECVFVDGFLYEHYSSTTITTYNYTLCRLVCILFLSIHQTSMHFYFVLRTKLSDGFGCCFVFSLHFQELAFRSLSLSVCLPGSFA